MALQIDIFGAIGQGFFGSGITAAQVAELLRDGANQDSIELRINSPGGDVFEGIAILNLLREANKPTTVFVEGLAASAASLVMLAGDPIIARGGAMIMIHRATGFASGTADDMRATAEALDRIDAQAAQLYASRTGLARDRVEQMMAEETWMTANEAFELGFVDEAEEPQRREAPENATRETFAQMTSTFGWKKPPLDALRLAAQFAALHRDGDNDNGKEGNTMPETVQQDPIDQERERVKTILSRGRELDQMELAATLVTEGVPADEATLRLVNAAIDKLRTSAVAPPGPDVERVTSARDEWNAQIAARVARGLTRAQAVRELVRDNPSLHERYLDEVNRK